MPWRHRLSSRFRVFAGWTVRRSKSSCVCIIQDVMPQSQLDRETRDAAGQDRGSLKQDTEDGSQPLDPARQSF